MLHEHTGKAGSVWQQLQTPYSHVISHMMSHSCNLCMCTQQIPVTLHLLQRCIYCFLSKEAPARVSHQQSDLSNQASCSCPSVCMAGPHDKVPGRRGRPPGSKNKRTLAMESLAQQGLTPGQQQAAMALLKQRAEQKRVEDEESLQAAMASGQKRRGRPPGSRNRPREEGETLRTCCVTLTAGVKQGIFPFICCCVCDT